MSAAPAPDARPAALSGQVVVVTGASSGIGEATARRLAREGATLVLAARRTARLEALADAIADAIADALADAAAHDQAAESPPRPLVVPTDVADRAACEALVARTLEAFGRLDVLVNNAGVMPLSLVKNARLDEWQRMVDVNLLGVLYCTGAALPHLLAQGRGHIVNVSSVAGRRVFAGGAVYCATKHAVTAFSEGLRLELGPAHGIRVTCIEPGAVRTELPRAIADEEFIAASREAGTMRGVTPLEAEDVAEAIAYALAAPPRATVHEVLVMPTSQPL
ncbi:MAG: SDR family oxidoreductase [Rubricoccaceae bacterium]